VESSVTNILNGTVATVDIKPAVLVFGIWDLVNAYRLAEKLKCPVIPREADWKNMGFTKFYIVGGPQEPESNSYVVVNLVDDTWEGTTAKVLGALA